jgi:hypothetical protein
MSIQVIVTPASTSTGPPNEDDYTSRHYVRQSIPQGQQRRYTSRSPQGRGAGICYYLFIVYFIIYFNIVTGISNDAMSTSIHESSALTDVEDAEDVVGPYKRVTGRRNKQTNKQTNKIQLQAWVN